MTKYVKRSYQLLLRCVSTIEVINSYVNKSNQLHFNYSEDFSLHQYNFNICFLILRFCANPILWSLLHICITAIHWHLINGLIMDSWSACFVIYFPMKVLMKKMLVLQYISNTKKDSCPDIFPCGCKHRLLSWNHKVV